MSWRTGGHVSRGTLLRLCFAAGLAALSLFLAGPAGATVARAASAHAHAATASRAHAASRRCLRHRAARTFCAAALRARHASRRHARGDRYVKPTRSRTSPGTGGQESARGTKDRGAGTGAEGSQGSEGGAGSGRSGAEASTEGSSGSATFEPGINSGSAAIWELPGAQELGAKVVRVGLQISETAEEFAPVVAAYAEKGIRVAPLASFYGTMPSPAEARNVANWAAWFGPGGSWWTDHPGGQYAIRTIEFGNETSFSYQYADDTSAGYASRAQTYAERFAEAAIATRAVNPQVGLLAQADSGNAGPIWVQNMFKAVPELASLVAGWTVHPYGTGWRAKLEELISQTAAQGAPASIPIDVTEWGLSTDNGLCVTENFGWNPCMSYEEAAGVLTQTVAEMRQMLRGRLGLMLLYQIRDQKPAGESNDREYYFGAVQSELQAKGDYTTAVESFLAEA